MDQFSLEALAAVLPASVILEVLEEYGKTGKRRRKLPPGLVVWLLVGMSLYRSLSIRSALQRVVQGLSSEVDWGWAEVPHATSITQARDRVGYQVLRGLFHRLVELLLGRYADVDRWKGLLVYAIDGTCFRSADTPENEAEFGRPGSSRGRSAFPQFRAVALQGVRSHVVTGVKFGPWRMGELTLAHHLLSQVKASSLLLVDRLYYSFAWLAGVGERDAYFVVRAKVGKRGARKWKTKSNLGPNEWRAVLDIPPYLKKKRPDLSNEIEIRVIKLEKKGFQPIWLVTNLLSSEDHSAKEIVELWMDRWEIELGFREMKCSLSEKKTTFRSHRPDRVRQEAYGLLIAYNCVRALMAEAAEAGGVQPRQLSFLDCLRHLQSMLVVMGYVDVDRLPDLYEVLLAQMATCVLQPRREGRTLPREVKIKMSTYKLKRTAA